MNDSPVMWKEITAQWLFEGKRNKLVHIQDMHGKTRRIKDSAGSLMTRLTVSFKVHSPRSEYESNTISFINLIFDDSYWIQKTILHRNGFQSLESNHIIT